MPEFTPILEKALPKRDYVARMPSYPLFPCINMYEPEGCSYVWFRLVPAYDDLELEECGDDGNDIDPSLREQFSDIGWDFIISPPYHSIKVGGRSFDERWTAFALKEGIAPGQPFCVCIEQPVYSKSWTDCGYEYDCDVECEIVAHATCKDPLRSWDRWLKRLHRTRMAIVDRDRRIKELQKIDRKSMFLYTSTYAVRGVDHYYPDYPLSESGVAVSLRTTRTDLDPKPRGERILAEGRSDNGSRDEAFALLLDNLRKTLPDLSDEVFLKGLPHHQHRW